MRWRERALHLRPIFTKTWSIHWWMLLDNRGISGNRKNIHTMFFNRSNYWWTHSRSICSSHLFHWYTLVSCGISSSRGEDCNRNISYSDYPSMQNLTYWYNSWLKLHYLTICFPFFFFIYQIADGDVCRNMTLPIYVILPRLLTCSSISAGWVT